MIAETVAQPLDRGAGHEDRAFHRVRDASLGAERPRDRREQPVDRLGQRRPDVREHERAGAVRVLRHARLDARLPEQRGLLVAGDAAHRHREPGRALGHGHAEAAARRRDRRAGTPRGTSNSAASSSDHAPRADVVEHRAARVRRIGRVHAAVGAAGEVPEDPRVDGAEREVGVGGDAARRAAATRASSPRSTGRARARSRGGSAARGPRRAARRSAAAVRRSCQTIARCRGRPVRAVPDHDRLALVGDADRGDRSRPRRRARPRPRRASRRVTRQMSSASCSTQPGCGKCCGNSRYERARGTPSSSTANARTPVVPASIAIDAGHRRRRRSAAASFGAASGDAASRSMVSAANAMPFGVSRSSNSSGWLEVADDPQACVRARPPRGTTTSRSSGSRNTAPARAAREEAGRAQHEVLGR